MRRSEREARLTRLAERLFAGAREVLTVGTQLALPEHTVTHVADVHALERAAVFDAALVRLDATLGVRTQVARVRRQLREGACLLLTTPSHPSPVERARALVTRVPPVLLTLEAICEALLGLGLLSPRVHDDVAGSSLVSARLPRECSELDVFFEQPAASVSR